MNLLHRGLLLALLLPTLPIVGAPPVTNQVILERIGDHPIEAHFDLPYAGNTHPRQMVDLYVPKNRTVTTPLPVVEFIHGGAWIGGDRKSAAGALGGLLLNGNYAGISVGYRMSTEAKWPAQIYDCKAAIRWIRGNAAKYNLDPDRIAVWGGSAGGHLTSLLIPLTNGGHNFHTDELNKRIFQYLEWQLRGVKSEISTEPFWSGRRADGSSRSLS